MKNGHDAIYKAMADEHRRKILMSLCRESLVAGELADIVGLAPNALSFHLKWLKDVGLVSVDREGRFLRYRANPNLVAEWARAILSTFGTSASLQQYQRESVAAAAGRYRAAEGESWHPAPAREDYASADGVVDRDDVLPTELL